MYAILWANKDIIRYIKFKFKFISNIDTWWQVSEKTRTRAWFFCLVFHREQTVSWAELRQASVKSPATVELSLAYSLLTVENHTKKPGPGYKNQNKIYIAINCIAGQTYKYAEKITENYYKNNLDVLPWPSRCLLGSMLPGLADMPTSGLVRRFVVVATCGHICLMLHSCTEGHIALQYQRVVVYVLWRVIIMRRGRFIWLWYDNHDH